MQRLEVSGAVRQLYSSLGVKGLLTVMQSLEAVPQVLVAERHLLTNGYGNDGFLFVSWDSRPTVLQPKTVPQAAVGTQQFR